MPFKTDTLLFNELPSYGFYGTQVLEGSIPTVTIPNIFLTT